MKGLPNRLLFTWWIITLVSLLVNQQAFAGTEIKIDDAKFEQNALFAKGKFKGEYLGSDSIILYDAITNTILSVVKQREQSNHFAFKISNLQQVPCYIKVQAGGISAIKEVEHAPDDCSAPLNHSQSEKGSTF